MVFFSFPSVVLHMDRCTFSWAPPSAAVHAKQMYSSGSSDGGGNKDHADTGAKATASSELLLLRELNLTIRRVRYSVHVYMGVAGPLQRGGGGGGGARSPTQSDYHILVSGPPYLLVIIQHE